MLKRWLHNIETAHPHISERDLAAGIETVSAFRGDILKYSPEIDAVYGSVNRKAYYVPSYAVDRLLGKFLEWAPYGTEQHLGEVIAFTSRHTSLTQHRSQWYGLPVRTFPVFCRMHSLFSNTPSWSDVYYGIMGSQRKTEIGDYYCLAYEASPMHTDVTPMEMLRDRKWPKLENIEETLGTLSGLHQQAAFLYNATYRLRIVKFFAGDVIEERLAEELGVEHRFHG